MAALKPFIHQHTKELCEVATIAKKWLIKVTVSRVSLLTHFLIAQLQLRQRYASFKHLRKYENLVLVNFFVAGVDGTIDNKLCIATSRQAY
jgi:hypothetical protein